ncbi:hypothetical protein B7P43_G12431 [Cryptotermes secundus]|uniref:Methyltransferase type 11 domain-containing protein n=1 Tax=Cryptotermes secundus TaxID=105785 RepID=A0A2J7PBS8_9NEOP|nr:methyltransferase-like protein 7A isoform X3 [Cryptotermes secundus]PNF13780.1 hypothetical protein B7P43_G12431 [Cryptotermes secundus]
MHLKRLTEFEELSLPVLSVRMSAFDITVLQYFTAYGLPVLSIVSFMLLIARNLSLIRSWILSRAISSFDASYESCLVDHKKSLFLPLHDIVSSDWKLRNKGCIRIVEIGFRTGENIKYYPKNSHLVVVDRNVYIHAYLNSNPGLTSKVNIERVILSSEDRLEAIPDSSVDAVVATFVLCSVTRINLILSEIKRILAPGGLYLYLEHCPDPRDTFLYKMQNFLTTTKLWPMIFDGCHLNRNALQEIKLAQFSDMNYQYVMIDSEHNKFSKLMRIHVIGTAVK